MASVIVMGLIRVKIPDSSDRFCEEKVFEEEKLSEVSHITATAILQRGTLEFDLEYRDTAITYSQNSPHDNARAEMVFVLLTAITEKFLNRRFIMHIALAKGVPSLQGGLNRR